MKIKVRITLIEEMLGTASANPDVHREFIASKSADADKVAEELAALHADEAMEKSITVFPRDEDGTPILFDYQVKGFLKDAVGLLTEIAEKQLKVGKTPLSKWTVKRIVDNYIFVSPRKIRLAPVGPPCVRQMCAETMTMSDTRVPLAICVRPLRAETMRGERVALVSSESVPAGTTFEIEIATMAKELMPLIREALDYGALKGLGQWRNSGKGRFTWTEVV